MTDFFKELKEMVEELGTAPTIETMPRRTLQDKGINGATAAHVIEEVHTPLNLAYLTFTTGSSAFQNIIGVTYNELPEKEKAAYKAFELTGVKKGQKMLVTYPPLVNVFTKTALENYGLTWSFLRRSSRDAFLSALYHEKPDVILGESSFIRFALEDAVNLGIDKDLPQNRIILVAGTPLDLELLPAAEKYGHSVHDLYGCQEFGWLTVDGVPVREDISQVKSPLGKDYCEIVVGGLPMGDSFVLAESGHICNTKGKIITYRRQRTHPEFEVIVKATPLSSAVTVIRAARTILRIKGRIVKVCPEIKTSSDVTQLELVPSITPKDSEEKRPILLWGPEKTRLFDLLVQAQLDFQQTGKSDPVWTKRR